MSCSMVFMNTDETDDWGFYVWLEMKFGFMFQLLPGNKLQATVELVTITYYAYLCLTTFYRILRWIHNYE